MFNRIMRGIMLYMYTECICRSKIPVLFQRGHAVTHCMISDKVFYVLIVAQVQVAEIVCLSHQFWDAGEFIMAEQLKQ